MLVRFFLLGIGPFFHCELETDGRHPNLHIIILVGGLISSLIVRRAGGELLGSTFGLPSKNSTSAPRRGA